MMTSYKELRKLTLGDKPVIIKFKCAGTNLRVPIVQVPTYNELCFMAQRLFRSELSTDLDNFVFRYEDEDGDLITIQDDADISHALSLSNLLKLTVNGKDKQSLKYKVTHPVSTPIEHFSQKLVGMNEQQTLAAVTAALVDLQHKIGAALKVIHSQHPGAVNDSAGTSKPVPGIGGVNDKTTNEAAGSAAKPAESKPLVLSAESLDQFLDKSSLLSRQLSVSSQASSHQNTFSPPARNQATQQSSMSNAVNQLQQQQAHSQLWTPPYHTHQQSQPQSTQQQQQQPQPQPQQQPSQPQTQQQQPQPQPQPQLQPPHAQAQQQQHQSHIQQIQPQSQQQYQQYASNSTPQQQQQQPQQQQQQQQFANQTQGHGQGQLQQATGQPMQGQSYAQTPQQQQYSLQTPVQQQQQQSLQQQPQQQPIGQQQQPIGQQQQLQQQPLQQQQQTPYMQPAYAPSPFVQNQQYSNQAHYSSLPFTRVGSGYAPQQQQQTGHR
ncbi:hypothetical protein BX616_001550 [Lobosporangium transversale]|nr:hypothetical protein BX616_001550 [Lobosporangium transversale]